LADRHQLAASWRCPNLLLTWLPLLLLLLLGPELLQSGLDCLPLLLCSRGCLWLRRAATAVGLWRTSACACCCCRLLLLLLLLLFLLLAGGTLLRDLLLNPQQLRKHLWVVANTCSCTRLLLLLLLLLTSRTYAAK
jgi:hypothetical protein